MTTENSAPFKKYSKLRFIEIYLFFIFRNLLYKVFNHLVFITKIETKSSKSDI